jgi:hypothetical protein
MYLRDIRWDVIGWTGLAQDRGEWRGLVNEVMKLWIP